MVLECNLRHCSLLRWETLQLLRSAMLLSAEKETRSDESRHSGTLDDRELDAVLVEAVDQRGFCESRSWSVYASSVKERKKNKYFIKADLILSLMMMINGSDSRLGHV